MAKKEYRDKVVIKQRMLLIFGILFLLFFALTCRMSYVMIGQSEWLKKKAIDQWTNEVTIDAKRGRILDRYQQELAISANVYRVDLDMNAIRDVLNDKQSKITREELVSKLASALKMDPQEVAKKMDAKRPNGQPVGALTLKRRIEKEDADKVRDIKVRGVLVSGDTKRYYPNNNFLAHVLGSTNSDGKGLTGIEVQYNNELTGTPGTIIGESDNKSKDLPDTISKYKKPIDGKDVVLTIDEMIQHFAEKGAEQALKDNAAKAVTIIVMNPKNGEVLAMANKPDFNPNNPRENAKTSEELQKIWRNRAVNDIFEPGSIFKVITASAALAENAVKENDQFNCTGSSKVANRVIHCANTKGHGQQNFVDILKNSCNVGFMEVGRRLGAAKLNEYIQKFGLGQKTGIDLPGEAAGIVKKTEKISEVDLATISFGQTDTLSCIQYMAAFNTIANGGKWIRPHLMKQIQHVDENNVVKVDHPYDNFGEREVLKPQVANTLRGYLEKVVSEGGGRNAYIEGYHVAGKTGTAQKINPVTGGYESGKYIASFAGMAPANDPQVTILVSIDEPSTGVYYGGLISAPVAKQVLYDVLNYMSLKADASSEDVAKSLLKDVVIPEVRGLKKEDAIKILKDNNLGYQIDGEGAYITDINPKPGFSVKESTKIVLYTGSTPNYNRVVVMPNLKGYDKETANQILNGIGLKAVFDGNGIVSDQSIEAGKEVNKGTSVTLEVEEIAD